MKSRGMLTHGRIRPVHLFRNTTNRSALRPYEVFQVLADRLFVAQVMMFFHQAVEQRLVAGAPHLLKRQWLESPKRSVMGVVSTTIGAGRAPSASRSYRTSPTRA